MNPNFLELIKYFSIFFIYLGFKAMKSSIINNFSLSFESSNSFNSGNSLISSINYIFEFNLYKKLYIGSSVLTGLNIITS